MSCGINNLGTPPVIEGDIEDHPVVFSGQIYCHIDYLLQGNGQFIESTAMTEPDAGAVNIGDVSLDKLLQQTEQALDFNLGTAPVFRWEAIQGQILDRVFVEVGNHAMHVLGSRLVTIESGQSLPLRPSAITIGYKGDMGRQFAESGGSIFISHEFGPFAGRY